MYAYGCCDEASLNVCSFCLAGRIFSHACSHFQRKNSLTLRDSFIMFGQWNNQQKNRHATAAFVSLSLERIFVGSRKMPKM